MTGFSSKNGYNRKPHRTKSVSVKLTETKLEIRKIVVPYATPKVVWVKFHLKKLSQPKNLSLNMFIIKFLVTTISHFTTFYNIQFLMSLSVPGLNFWNFRHELYYLRWDKLNIGHTGIEKNVHKQICLGKLLVWTRQYFLVDTNLFQSNFVEKNPS